jgi:hypothetical protein
MYLDLEIEGGCLHLESSIWGGEYDSEQHYTFSKEETDRLFSIISPEDFIALIREKHLTGMCEFLKEKGISCGTVTI